MSEYITKTEAADFFQEVKDLFIQTEQFLKNKFQETERMLKEKSLETERILKEKSLETQQKFQETDRVLKEQSQATSKLERLFTSQWGKLIESLIEGDLINLLQNFGITVQYTTTRLKGRNSSGQQYEFDILAHDGDAVVVVEVKTTLRPDDVKEFIAELSQFKTWVPSYASKTVHGAVAYLTADAAADTMAERRGLMLIRATGDSARIVNQPGFIPRAW